MQSSPLIPATSSIFSRLMTPRLVTVSISHGGKTSITVLAHKWPGLDVHARHVVM